jgi:hypothetical protein
VLFVWELMLRLDIREEEEEEEEEEEDKKEEKKYNDMYRLCIAD